MEATERFKDMNLLRKEGPERITTIPTRASSRHQAAFSLEVSMTWRGIVGKLLYPDAFEDYVRALKFGAWRPKFIIVHNTSAPDTATWQNWQKRNPPITNENWAQSLVGYLWR